MRILVLGITGMLGHKAFEYFSGLKNYDTFGTLRKENDILKYFNKSINKENIFSNINALNTEGVYKIINKIKPDIILNCIGIIKQLKESKDPMLSIEINALFPHKLASFLEGTTTRLVHISTDCVFSGNKGNYFEKDVSDAKDLYGKTKFLGELNSYKNSITLRTSIIGPELKTKVSLLEWFLSQKDDINGYVNAIYSGFPTNELINIIDNYIIPNNNLYGLYNVSSSSINKFELLSLIKKEYKKNILIKPFQGFKNDKSLNCERFMSDFKYQFKSWELMVKEMKETHIKNPY